MLHNLLIIYEYFSVESLQIYLGACKMYRNITIELFMVRWEYAICILFITKHSSCFNILNLVIRHGTSEKLYILRLEY